MKEHSELAQSGNFLGPVFVPIWHGQTGRRALFYRMKRPNAVPETCAISPRAVPHRTRRLGMARRSCPARSPRRPGFSSRGGILRSRSASGSRFVAGQITSAVSAWGAKGRKRARFEGVSVADLPRRQCFRALTHANMRPSLAPRVGKRSPAYDHAVRPPTLWAPRDSERRRNWRRFSMHERHQAFWLVVKAPFMSNCSTA
jgi:hypothetical protein